MPRAVTVDLVTHDEKSGEFVLYLVEDGPWPFDEAGWRECLAAIQERILSVADVAIDGLLARQYPDSAGKAVRIQIDSPSGCPRQLTTLIEAVRRFLSEDESYAAGVASSPQIRGLRVVTGQEIGRFSAGMDAADPS